MRRIIWCINISVLLFLPATFGVSIPQSTIGEAVEKVIPESAVVDVVEKISPQSVIGDAVEKIISELPSGIEVEKVIVTQEVRQKPEPVWVPDTENEIWKELNFPQEPEDVPEGEPVPTSPPVQPSSVDLQELNLTISEEGGVPRFIGRGGLACRCGSPPIRIVGGELAKINDIPWTVALVRKGGFFNPFGGTRPFCGGTIINDRYILTASHCVDGQVASGISVLVNEQDLLVSSETAGSTKKFGVSQIIMHSAYNRRNVENDIALLKLDTPIQIGSTETPVVPACLPANNDNDFSGIQALVSGWGTTSEGGGVSPSLRKVDVPIITNTACNNSKYKNKILPGMMCAGYLETGKKDSCQGDSGGPLVINNGPSRKTLVGVVSWGYGCAKPNAPGVYTRVAYYPKWILDNTRDAQWCGE